MDSLPDLYPIVIPSIQRRPFDCFGEGLRYRGPQDQRYARESLQNIKELLMAEREHHDHRYPRETLQNVKEMPLAEREDHDDDDFDDNDDDENNDDAERRPPTKYHKKSYKNVSERGTSIFWYAQLRLYGVSCRPAKADVLRKLFMEKIQSGLRSPPYRLLKLEAQLNERFRRENAQARHGQYEALVGPVKKILFYPKRFFHEYFEDESRSLISLQRQFPDEARDAAEALGLHFSCELIRGRFWTIVGRDAESVERDLHAIGEDEEARHQGEKRRKVDEDEGSEAPSPDEEMQQRRKMSQEEELNAAEEPNATEEPNAAEGPNAAEDATTENFRKMDVVRMDRLWQTLNDQRKLELYTTRFLSEQFLSEGREKFVQAFKETETIKRNEIRAAAELLGLRTAAVSFAVGDARPEWTVVGRDLAAVEERRREIEALGYEMLPETEKFKRFPKRFLSEQLLGGNEREDRVVIVEMRSPRPPLPPLFARMEETLLKHAKNGKEKVVALGDPPQGLPEAAKSLGLLMMADSVGLRWIVVGRDSPFVRECLERIKAELAKPESRRVDEQVRFMHEELKAEATDAPAELPFDDVRGEWSMECDGVQWKDADDNSLDDDDDIYERAEEPGEYANAEGYGEALKKMSIFFHRGPPPISRQEDDPSSTASAASENGEKDDPVSAPPPASEFPSPRLCANFYVGLFGGLLRSNSGPLPPSLSFPSAEIYFEFKGWDEAAGEPFDATKLPREGSLTFHSRTLFKCVLKSMYGVMNLVGRKIGHKPNVECYDWDDLPPLN